MTGVASAPLDQPSLPQPPAPDLDAERQEVLVAVNQLIEGIDAWHAWFQVLRSEGDADPGLALRYRDLCCAAIQALCAHQVKVAPFHEKAPDEIFRMLPPLPDGSLGGVDLRWDAPANEWRSKDRARWQESVEFLNQYYGTGGRYDSSLELRAAALKARELLTQFPHAVLPKAPEQFASSSIIADDQIQLSIVDAARYVGVNERTIRRWRESGKLTLLKASPRAFIFSKSALDILRQARQ